MRRLLLSTVLVIAVIALTPSPSSAAPLGYTRATIAGEDRIYEIDMATGTMTLLGNSGIPPATRALVLAGDGTLFGSNAGNLYTFDRTTGAATLVGPHGCCSIMSAMTFDSDGNLWGISGNPSSLYRIDRDSGAATLVGPTNGHLLSGLAGDCDGNVFAADGADDTLLLLDTADGSTTTVGPFGVDVGSGSLAFDASGTLWALVRPANPPGTPSQTYTVDTTSGALTLEAASVAGNNPSDVALGPLACGTPPSSVPSGPTSSSTSPSTAAAASVRPTFTG